MRTAALILLLALSAAFSAQAQRTVVTVGSGRRVALVIGNNAYPWGPLVNSANDARALAAMLPRVGFDAKDVTLLVDANLKQMQKAGRDFVEKLRPDDLAFVFYSGHGVEVRGENYLIPIDFPPNASDLEARDEAYSAQQLLRDLESSGAKTRVMILDACRNNPLRASRAAGGGLGRMDGEGTLIVFATSAGKTADDNPRGRNGLFTTELLKALPTPGVPLTQLMNDVSRAVYRDSGEKKQLPAIYGLLLEDFPLIAGNGGAVNPVAPDPDIAAWTAIGNSTTPEDFDDFVTAFPGSKYTPAARLKGASLRRADVWMPDTATQTERVRTNPKDGQRYVRIEPGTFTMGCSPGDSQCLADERPAHQVEITKGFWLGQTAVTVGAWKKYRAATNAPALPGADSLGRKLNESAGNDSVPAVAMTWDEAKNYCEWSGGRLPTEAEWEYAARAGSTGARYGNLDEIAWYGDNSGNQRIDSTALYQADAKSYAQKLFDNGNGPKPVGQKAPNAWNLYDMLGNVWQWTADWYGEKYYDANDGRDPQGPPGGTQRALRGGSWVGGPSGVRVSSRNWGVPGNHYGNFGFGVRGINSLYSFLFFLFLLPAAEKARGAAGFPGGEAAGRFSLRYSVSVERGRCCAAPRFFLFGNNNPANVHVSQRNRNAPGDRNNNIGVRCVGDAG